MKEKLLRQQIKKKSLININKKEGNLSKFKPTKLQLYLWLKAQDAWPNVGQQLIKANLILNH